VAPAVAAAAPAAAAPAPAAALRVAEGCQQVPREREVVTGVVYTPSPVLTDAVDVRETLRGSAAVGRADCA